MRNSPFRWILAVFLLLLDIYFFQALQTILYPVPEAVSTGIIIVYWVISAASLAGLILLPYLHFNKKAGLRGATIFSIITGLFFAKGIAAVFFLADDVRRVVQWAGLQFFPSGNGTAAAGRSVMLSWAGVLAGSGLFTALVYGFGNKYTYRVRRQRLHFDHLPAAFKGLKIVHISDIHAGSFNDREAVMQGVETILDQEPDLILFTGDLVNNVADEMNDYRDVFGKLNAPLGVYSILGNHDYGDYVKWERPEDKRENLERLKQVHRAMGWRLLMNEHVELKRGEDSIALLGVENWSAKSRFPRHGDLKSAHAGTQAYPFKILMSHDPSHWKAEVCESYPDIDLMLAGHTHGMQFGFEIPGLKWSPVQYLYKEWAGLYQHRPANGRKTPQKLYINRGFGFLGYPGRVGILPEITVLELQ